MKGKNKEIEDAWAEQKKKWKDKYGKLVQLTVENKDRSFEIFMRKADSLPSYFGTMSRAISALEKDEPVAAGEIILKSCYLGGDFGENLNEYKKDSKEYLSACFYCSQLVTVQKGNFQYT